MATDASGNYLIGSVADLQTLANFVNGGGDTAGKTFKLTANISGVGFHIGTETNKFKGTLDGGGHTITVNYSDGGALFNFVDGAKIQHLTVDGTINTSTKFAAGIVSQTDGETKIDNCTSSVTINSTVAGDGTHGGFVGVSGGNLTISNSIFNGSLLSTGEKETNSCGGFVGWRNGLLTITDSFFNPTQNTVGTSGSATFARNGATLIGGCYIETFGDAQGSQVYQFTATLPNGVTSDDVHTFGGTNYITANKVTFSYGGHRYIYNDAAQITSVTLNSGKLYVNGAEIAVDPLESITQDESGNYLIGTKEQLQALADFVNGGGDTSGKTFKLTANISGVNFHIGTETNKFKGTFDGGGSCKITVNYSDGGALFNFVDGAKIQYLTVDGTINTSAKYAAGFVAQASGKVYIQNCTSSVTINSTVAGDGTHGGFVAVNNYWIEIKNCLFNGSLLGENTDSCGGFIGYNGNIANVNNSNLFAPTEVTISDNNSATLFRGSASGNRSGCYTETFGTAQGTQVYKLNGSLPDGVTTSDTRTFGGTTYLKASGTLNYNGKSYVYSVTGDTTITVDNGKLFVNDTELKLPFLDTLDTDSDGYYLIGTLEDLQGFATYAYEQSAKGDYLEGKKFKLTADITLPEVADGQSNWSALPAFQGEFNGDNHTIDNMTIRTTGGSQGCFFQNVGTYGTVKNLNLTNVDISGNFGYCGGIAFDNYGTIDSCNVTGSIQGVSWLGGIAANNSGTIQYCFADVEISDVSYAGAIVGGQGKHGRIYSTSYHSDRNISGGGNNGAGTVDDNVKYYRLNLPEGVTASGDGVIEKFGNYYFRWTDTTITLSEPVGDITTFTTVAQDMTITASIDLTGAGTANNPYQIATPEDLQTLAAYVNTGNTCAGKYFKLMGNINMSGINFAGIGNETTAFSGTFDGDGNTISNLTINKAGGYRLGLFGCVDGATIQNVNLTGVNINASGGLGAVVGYAKSSTINNVTATGSISGTNDAGVYVGGLVGRLDEHTYNTITNCKADVAVSGTNAFALFGDLDPAFIRVNNCYYRGVEHGGVTGITQIYKLTIPDDLTASGSLIEFGGNTYAAADTQITLTVNDDNSFEKVTGISNATASGDNYTCTVGTSDVEFKLEGIPKIGNLVFDGTDTYSISDEAGLRALAAHVNAGNNCAGMKFKLTQDITLSGTWTAIGSRQNNFCGTFDGGDFTISGLTTNTNSVYQGLFGYLNGATVKRVNLSGVDITASDWAGAIAGYAAGSTISNCTASGTIKAVNYNLAGEYHGGIVGILSSGTVDTCTFSGTVDSTKADYDAAGYQGGIVGSAVSGTIKNSAYIGGEVKGGGSNVGAIAGYFYDGTDGGGNPFVFTDNYFYGTFGEGVNTSGGTQLYKLTLPEGVTATGDDIYLTTEGGVTYIKAGGTVTINFGAGRLTINGQTVTGGTYQLTMPDEDISAEFTEADFMANKNPQTPQEAIQKFMASLVNHGYAYSNDIGTAMLDSAVQAASRFGSIEEVINQMMADQVAAEKEAVEEVLGSEYAGKTLAEVDGSILSAAASTYDTANTSNAYYDSGNDGRSTVENFIKERKALIFLEKYCGIQLNTKPWINSEGKVTAYTGVSSGNVDTGAITGSDANITLKVGDKVNGTTLIAEDLQSLATAYGNKAQLVGDTLTIGTGTEKTERSVVPEQLINTYTATNSAAQNIITNTRNWVVQATDNDDTITANGADSINAGGGKDLVTVNGDGATVTSGEGADTVEISAQVKNVTLTDLNADDQMTISGTFEVGAVKVEDMMLVITDKTGTRKIKLGDFETAVNSTVNVNSASQKIGDWLTESGIDLNNLTAADNNDYSNHWLSSNNVSDNDNIGVEDGRIAPDTSYTPTPVEEPETSTSQPATVKEKARLRSSANTAGGTVTVNLGNVNTSAAGNVQVDGQNVGTLSSTFPAGTTTFTRNGLTIHLLGRSTDSKPSNIEALTYNDLTDAEKAVVAGLFKWWAADCLTLDNETYGVDFNSDTAMVNEIGLYFYTDEDSSTLAAVNNSQRSDDGYCTMLYLNVNMRFYGNVDSTDLDGEGKYTVGGKEQSGGFLDRTLAHEFVHAIMASNVNFFQYLPQFITEGTAELSHGIDDERGSTIFNLAYDADALAESMSMKPGTGNNDSYASGYMFLRYFARQAALQTLTAPAFGDITAEVNLANFSVGDVLYADDSGNVSTDNSGILLGQIATDEEGTNYYQVYDYGVKQIVTTSATIPDVYGVTANVKISGGDGYDGVEVVEGATEVNTGGGNDFVQVKGQYATINTGAGDDEVYISDGSHNTIDLGDGDNYIEINGAPFSGNGYLIAYNYGNSITGGTGNDSISNGANVVYIDSEGYMYSESVAGATAYDFYYSNNELKVDLGDGDNQIALNYVYDSDIKTGAGTDMVIIDYASNVSIDTGAYVDLVSVGGGTGNVIDTGDDKDYVAMRMNNSTVNSGAGDDYVVFGTLNENLFAASYTILNSNLIDLGDGTDQIDFAGSNNTIIGGTGDDYIYQINGGNGGNAYHFSGEFGNDSIQGFMSNDTIHIAENYTTEFADNVLTVKNGSVVKGTIKFVSGDFTTSNVVADLAEEVEPVPLTADEQGNYLINGVDDLTALATYVNNGNNCAGLTFKLTANIDIADAEVMNNFAGNFDGGGHLLTNADTDIFGNGTVSNLYYHGAATIDGATKVYTLNLPTGVTASDALAFDGTNYYSGEVTLTIGNGTALGKVTGIDNVAADSSGQVTFNVASDVTITSENIFYAVTVNGATISGNSISVGGTDYYRGEVTATTETGYVVDSPVTIDKATEISATLDTANHYAFGNATDGYTLATVDNTKDYPELVQVYELTLPNNVTAQGSIVVTDGDKTYAAGEVTLKAAAGYTIDNVTVNGAPDDDGVFTVNGDTNITANVTAIVEEDNIFNSAGTAVIVGGTSGDFHANSTLYSITASQENSTLIANAKANTILVAGGNENILTGGTGNDTFKFTAGGGIVTDYGIGATKDGSGKATTANGVDVVKVDGAVTGIYFERDGNTKKSATFTATITYDATPNDTTDADQVIVLKNIAKKPTKTNSNPSKAIYQTNDVAAATLKIWDTSSGKQAVLSAAKLKKLFVDDDSDVFTGILKEKTDYLVNVTNGITPEKNPFATQLTFTGGNKH